MSSKSITTLQKYLFLHTFLWDWRLFSFLTFWMTIKNPRGVQVLFLLIMLILFLVQDNTILFHLNFHWNNLFFTIWVLFWNIVGYIFSFLAYKILRANVKFLFSIFFNHLFLVQTFFLQSCVYLKKGLVFVIISEHFPISSWFNANVRAYWKHLLYFLLIGFIVAFFVFYPIRRIYIWSTTTWIYFTIFITV